MYESTPTLGVDDLIYQAQKKHKKWNFASARINYSRTGHNLVIDLSTEAGWERLPYYTALEEFISDFRPSVIAVSSTSKEFSWLIQLLKTLELGGATVIAGGVHVTLAPMAAFAASYDVIDYFFVGESFLSFPDFLEGVGVRARTGRRDLPSPDRFIRQQTNLKTFESLEITPASHCRTTSWGDKTVLRFQSQRGCMYRCTFCVVPNTKELPGHMMRPLHRIEDFLNSVARWREAAGDVGKNLLIYLEDGNFGGPPNSPAGKYAREVLPLFSKYSLNFGIQVRYDNLESEYLDKLSNGNVTYLFTSVESSDQHVLNNMKKGQCFSPDEIMSRFKSIDRHGIDYTISTIVGARGASLRVDLESAKLVKEISPLNACFELAKVYPGSTDALLYKKERNVDVDSVYSTGIGLTNNPELGPEDDGTLLWLGEEEAASRAKQVESIFTSDKLFLTFRRGFVRNAAKHSKVFQDDSRKKAV
jgi:hypothetical protein